MSEQISNAQPMFSLQRAYVKGASLEMPKGAATFTENLQLQTHLDMALMVSKLNDNTWETCIRCTVTMKNEADNSAVMVLEVDQCGIFDVRNIPEQELPNLLEIGCPSILTPYLRAAVTDILARATLPLFYLPEINWAMVRQQRMQAEAAQPEALGTKPTLTVVQ